MNDTRFACYVLEPTDQVRESLVRYSYDLKCEVSTRSFHYAQTIIGDRKSRDCDVTVNVPVVPPVDPRWPTQCACGYVFQQKDEWQTAVRHLYKCSDTGELVLLQDARPGGLYRTPWLEENEEGKRRNEWTAADGQSWHCVLPGGRHWCIDSRASNCDSPCLNCGKPYNLHAGSLCNANAPQPGTGVQYYVDARPQHKCWCRHGAAPLFHVDKVGETCGAGAGSISVPNWHGFLHNGHLVKC